MSGQLGLCPRCSKREGKLIDAGHGRFRFYASCMSCFMTQVARTEGIAAKLWNQGKLAREDQEKRR